MPNVPYVAPVAQALVGVASQGAHAIFDFCMQNKPLAVLAAALTLKTPVMDAYNEYNKNGFANLKPATSSIGTFCNFITKDVIGGKVASFGAIYMASQAESTVGKVGFGLLAAIATTAVNKLPGLSQAAAKMPAAVLSYTPAAVSQCFTKPLNAVVQDTFKACVGQFTR